MSKPEAEKQTATTPTPTEGEKLVARYGLGKLHIPAWGSPTLMVEASNAKEAEKLAWKQRTPKYIPGSVSEYPYKEDKIFGVTFKDNKVEKTIPLKSKGTTILMHRDVFALLKPTVGLVKEVEVTFSGRGLSLRQMDMTHIMLVDMELGRRYFKGLPRKPITIAFNDTDPHPLAQLPKVYELMDTAKTVKFVVVFIGLTREQEVYTDGSKKIAEKGTVDIAGITVAEISPSARPVPIPKVLKLTKSTIRVKEFKQILEKADKAGFDGISLLKKGSKFLSRFTPGKLELLLNKAATTPSGKVDSAFNIKNLSSMMVPLWGEKAELYAGQRVPVKIHYSLKGGFVDCYLAPKIEEKA